MTERRVRSLWLPFGTNPAASIRLLCLPHAGAGATVYRAWGSSLPAWINVCPVQPPGREKRQREAPLTSVEQLVARLAPEVLASVRPPYALFGHSTGALCSFELIRELRRLGGPLPVHLFVAGRPAPQLPMQRTRLSGLAADELATALRRLGGTPEEVLADHDVLRRIQPLLVADFSVNEAYSHRTESPLDVPITAFTATNDAGADPPKVAAWAEQTSAGFQLRTLVGGHFAVFDRASEVLDCIAATLEPWSVER
ncbi:MAG TPA: thioesterase domain-containing protein [Pseudonocardiaceae bacterium]|nr:thioesterase domain-containing protein [Pseudonocardiaceae bacterium]